MKRLLILLILVLGAGYGLFHFSRTSESPSPLAIDPNGSDLARGLRETNQYYREYREKVREQMSQPPVDGLDERLARELARLEQEARDKPAEDLDPDYAEALKFHADERWPEAEAAYLRALAKDPDSITLLSALMAVRGVRMNDYAAANQYAARIIELAPETPGIYDRYLEQARYAQTEDAAIEQLKVWQARAPGPIGFAIAKAYSAREDLAQADLAFREALPRVTEDVQGEVYKEWAELEIKAGDYSSALEKLKSSLLSTAAYNRSLPPESPKARRDETQAALRYIALSIQQKDVREAKELLAALLEREPHNTEFLAYKTNLERLMGEERITPKALD